MDCRRPDRPGHIRCTTRHLGDEPSPLSRPPVQEPRTAGRYSGGSVAQVMALAGGRARPRRGLITATMRSSPGGCGHVPGSGTTVWPGRVRGRRRQARPVRRRGHRHVPWRHLPTFRPDYRSGRPGRAAGTHMGRRSRGPGEAQGGAAGGLPRERPAEAPDVPSPGKLVRVRRQPREIGVVPLVGAGRAPCRSHARAWCVSLGWITQVRRAVRTRELMARAAACGKPGNSSFRRAAIVSRQG